MLIFEVGSESWYNRLNESRTVFTKTLSIVLLLERAVD